MHDAWFADEESVRKAVGLFEKPVVDPKLNAVEVSILSIFTFVIGNTT